MGLPKGDLWVVKIDKDTTFLAAYKPLPARVKRGSWKRPPNTPLGCDMFIKADFFPELTQYDDPIPVEIVEAEEETGLYIACYNDYFGNEQHLYNVKPVFNEAGTGLDYSRMQEDEEFDGFHVSSRVDAKAGNIYNVKLVRREVINKEVIKKLTEKPKRESGNWLEKIKKILNNNGRDNKEN